jgi:hypothetical protein
MTCGGAGCGAGYTALGCPPSPPTPTNPPLPPAPPAPTVTTPTVVVVVVVEALPPFEDAVWVPAGPQATATTAEHGSPKRRARKEGRMEPLHNRIALRALRLRPAMT